VNRPSLLCVLLFLCTLPLFAQIPRTFSYQGILTDSSGAPKPDGTYLMTFRLYPSGSGGTPAWSESKSLQLKGGLFSTSLGDATPFPGSLLFNTQYWLSVQIGTGPELAPRTAMTATPYSLSSEKSDSARVSGGVAPNSVTTSGIADNAVTSAKIQNGSIQFSDVGQNGASSGQVMKWNGVSWSAGNDSLGAAGSTGPWQLNGSSAYYIGGNVGIGTSTPGFPLNFASTSGDKISLWGGSGAHYGVGIQGGLLQIHTDIVSSDITFGYGSSGAFTEKMRIKGNGNVGIGTSTPNAPLTFAPGLGKKITLYPGATGDVGFAVAGNRLQIYSDNPNADVAIGYDAAGVFNERFAVKPNGAVAVSGNVGATQQVLTSGGSAASAQWQPIGSIVQTFYNNTSQSSPTLTPAAPDFTFNHSYTITVAGNARLIISGNFGARSNSGISNSEEIFIINVNGTDVKFFTPHDSPNGLYTTTSISNFMFDVGPGAHTIEFKVHHYTLAGSNSFVTISSSSIIVMPLQ
jgi:hypothetical protein